MKSFKDFRGSLNEGSLSKETNPPALLILRRRGFRMFPDGAKIAMYTADKYNLMFTVPYGGNMLGAKMGPLMGMRSEETNLDEYVNVFGGLGASAGDAIKRAIKRKFAPPKPKKMKPRSVTRQPPQPTP